MTPENLSIVAQLERLSPSMSTKTKKERNQIQLWCMGQWCANTGYSNLNVDKSESTSIFLNPCGANPNPDSKSTGHRRATPTRIWNRIWIRIKPVFLEFESSFLSYKSEPESESGLESGFKSEYVRFRHHWYGIPVYSQKEKYLKLRKVFRRWVLKFAGHISVVLITCWLPWLCQNVIDQWQLKTEKSLWNFNPFQKSILQFTMFRQRLFRLRLCWLYRLSSLKVGVIPKEGCVRPCTSILI